MVQVYCGNWKAMVAFAAIFRCYPIPQMALEASIRGRK
jgi:hypothetical protein